MDKITKEAANSSLFITLSPNVSKMAKVTGLSRQTIYDILNQKHDSRPESIAAFNKYLRFLRDQREKIARTIT